MDPSPFNSPLVVVVVEHLMKMVHFTPYTKIITSKIYPNYFLVLFFNIMASLKITIA